jgi:drug/metabolite transporter (DMT)-like permease
LRFAGELAALGTAGSWSIGSNLFAAAGRRMNSLVLNRLRLVLASIFLCLALLVVRGSPWPTWATEAQLWLLVVSGLVGFVFGDSFYFRSLVILGPGRAGLLASTAPIFTVAIAWPALGEAPGRLALIGMALTIGGVFWVLREREQREDVHVEGSRGAGVVAGLLGALGQGAGYVLSKVALGTGIDALSATVIRVVAAVIGIWTLAAVRGEVPRTLAALRDRRASAFMVGGTFFGPFLGVTLSLVAIEHIPAGVAASIIAFHPVLTILISACFHGERLTLRTLAGALIAVAGVVVLFMR